MRTVKEWIGKTDDSDPPRSVKLRVLKAFGDTCQCGCGVKIVTGIGWDTDHKIPIWKDGENREANLWPLRNACHKVKTKVEAGERAKERQVTFKHLGLKTKKSGRGWPCGADSKFKKKLDGSVVLRNKKG